MTYILLNELEAISLAISNDTCRAYLHGVRVENYKEGRQGLIATSGHILAALHSQPVDNLTSSFTLPIGVIKDILTQGKAQEKELRRSSLTVAVQVTDTTWQLGVFGANEDFYGNKEAINTYAPLVGIFPDYRRFIPQAPTIPQALTVSYDTKLLAIFGKIGKLLRNRSTIEITARGAADPSLINLLTIPNFTGVIMPVREDKRC